MFSNISANKRAKLITSDQGHGKKQIGHLTLSGKDVIRIITDTLVELWGGGNPHVMAIELQRSTPVRAASACSKSFSAISSVHNWERGKHPRSLSSWTHWASCTAARGGKQARSPSTGEWMKEKVTNTRWNSTQLQESDLSICWERHGSGDHSAQDAKPGTKRQILKGSFSA